MGFLVIAGPCQIESEKLTMEIAEELRSIGKNLNTEIIFKASFDKANRSSIKSFRGVGQKEGLRILARVKKDLGLKVITDVHETCQVGTVSSVVDILQIPAMLCRQTDLLVASSKSGKPVNVKKGQWLSPSDTYFVVEKLKESGCKEFYITERGTSFGYNRLINDFGGFPEVRRYAPLIFDASHSCQRMGGGETSGGNRELTEVLARCAVAAGVDGLFFEVRPEPWNSPSDGDTIYELNKFQALLKRLLDLDGIIPKIIL